MTSTTDDWKVLHVLVDDNDDWLHALLPTTTPQHQHQRTDQFHVDGTKSRVNDILSGSSNKNNHHDSSESNKDIVCSHDLSMAFDAMEMDIVDSLPTRVFVMLATTNDDDATHASQLSEITMSSNSSIAKE
jgi:hypothetical protein